MSLMFEPSKSSTIVLVQFGLEYHVLHLSWDHFYIFVLAPLGPFWGSIWAILAPLGLWPAQWTLLAALSPLQASINSFHSRKKYPSDDTIMQGQHKSGKSRISDRLKKVSFLDFVSEASYADINNKLGFTSFQQSQQTKIKIYIWIHNHYLKQ